MTMFDFLIVKLTMFNFTSLVVDYQSLIVNCRCLIVHYQSSTLILQFLIIQLLIIDLQLLIIDLIVFYWFSIIRGCWLSVSHWLNLSSVMQWDNSIHKLRWNLIQWLVGTQPFLLPQSLGSSVTSYHCMVKQVVQPFTTAYMHVHCWETLAFAGM